MITCSPFAKILTVYIMFVITCLGNCSHKWHIIVEGLGALPETTRVFIQVTMDAWVA